MDNLLKQMRGRSSGSGQDNNKAEQGRDRDTRLFPQKSQSFKEKKPNQSWWRRQFSSRQMNRGYESENEIEHVTAVAAAVFAVFSIDESEIANRKKVIDKPKTSPKEFENFKEDTHIEARAPNPPPVLRKVSRRFSDKDVLKDTEVSDEKMKEKDKPQKLTGPPSFRKTTTFSDQISHISDEKIPQPTVQQSPPPRPPPQRPPTPHIVKKPPTETKKPLPIPTPTPTKPYGAKETKADAWEKAEMAEIKDRYEKVNYTISNWEKKKRDKARLKFELSQGVGVDRRKREKAQKKYEEDTEFIKQIAGEARAKAEDRRRKEVLKAIHKADTIRKTGELPVTCFCC